MNRDPILLVDEFLRSDEARLRRNGVVALGAIAGAVCTERLIEVALNDPDAQVREAAEKELTELLRENDADLTSVYAKSEDEPERKSRVYALAGRLRARGAAIRTFRASIRSELGLFFAAYPTRGWKFYFRALPAALGGGLALVVFLAITFGVVASSGGFIRGVSGDLITAALVGYLFSVVFAELATLFTTAYGFRVSPRVGIAIETVFAFVIPLVLYALLALLMVLVMGTSDIKILLPGGVILVTVMAGVRVFTIVAAGSGRTRIRSLLKGTAVGTVGGTLVATVAIVVMLRGDTEQTIVWTFAVPMCGALAAAFASIDARVPIAARSRTNRIAAQLMLLLVATLPVILLLSFYLGRRTGKDALLSLPVGRTIDSSTARHTVPITEAPYRVRLNVKNRHSVLARTNSYDGMRLTDKAGRTVVESSYSGFEQDLDVGTYDLYYSPYSGVELTSRDGLPRTIETFARPFRPRSWSRSSAIARTWLSTPRLLTVTFRDATAPKPGAFPAGEDYALTDTMAVTDTMATDTTMTSSDTADDLVAMQRRSHAETQVHRAAENAKQGRIALALSDVREARRIDPNVSIDASTWNVLCWQATIRNQAAEVVDEACEYAVTLDPADVSIRDSRGLARALTGRRAGAIEDFNAYIGGTTNEARRQQRARWVKKLKEGTGPFTLTPEEMKGLMTQ